MVRFMTILTLFCLLISFSAQAAEINAAGEKHLETMFSALITQQKQALADSGATLQTGGKILVEQAKDYYAVTLPPMTLTRPDGTKGKIGLIAINATPTEKAGNWKMSVALPKSIMYADATGEPAMVIDIGTQEMGGVWSESLKNFSKLAARYGNIKITDFQLKQTTTIGQLDIASDLNETQKDFWSGPVKFSLNNFDITKPNNNKIINFKDAQFALNFNNFSPTKIRQQISQNAQKPGTDYDLIKAFLKNFGEGFTLQGAINNLAVNTTTTKEMPASQFTLTNGNIAMSLSGLNSQKVNKTLKLNFNGLKPLDNTHPDNVFTPENMTLNMDLKNFPLNDMIDLAYKLAPTDMNNPSAKQVAAMQAMISLPQILSQADTIMTVKDTSYGNATYKTDVNGTIKANKNSLLGATGDVVFATEGVDKLIAAVQDKPNQQKNLEKLQTIKKVCEKKETKHICRVTLDDQAQIKVNGQDINTIFGQPAQ